jgi:hypothetical protein
MNDACFIVRDHDGHKLAYVYFACCSDRLRCRILSLGGGETALHSRQDVVALCDYGKENPRMQGKA